MDRLFGGSGLCHDAAMITRVLVAALAPVDDAIAPARQRRDDGFEVIYGGGQLDPRQVAHIARAEDVRHVVVVIDPAEFTDAESPEDARAKARQRITEALEAIEIDDVEVVTLISPKAH